LWEHHSFVVPLGREFKRLKIVIIPAVKTYFSVSNRVAMGAGCGFGPKIAIIPIMSPQKAVKQTTQTNTRLKRSFMARSPSVGDSTPNIPGVPRRVTDLRQIEGEQRTQGAQLSPVAVSGKPKRGPRGDRGTLRA
jgi:hypothetical protein